MSDGNKVTWNFKSWKENWEDRLVGQASTLLGWLQELWTMKGNKWSAKDSKFDNIFNSVTEI